MSDYTKTTDFAAKDALASGDPNKVVKGTEFDTEFNALETAVNSKANTAGPTFTGTLTAADLTVTGTVTFDDDIGFSDANPVILGADTDGTLTVGANTGSLGSKAIFYGDTHATKAGDFELYDDATLELHFDASGSTFDFQANALTTTGAITASGGGSLTGTWSDLGTVTTVDINGGTIDGTVIGGSSAAAGSFTTLGASGAASLADLTCTTLTGGDLTAAKAGTGDNAQITVRNGSGGMQWVARNSGDFRWFETDAAGSYVDDIMLYTYGTNNIDWQANNFVDLGTVTAAGNISSQAGFTAGQSDNTQGYIYLYGPGTGLNSGGIALFYTAADFDTTYNYFSIQAYQDELAIGHSANGLAGVRWDGATWDFQANSITTTGAFGCGALTASGNASFSGGNVKTFEFGTGFVLQNSANETVIAGTPNAETSLYYNSVSEFQTQDSDANYATSGAQVKDHGGTLRDVGFNVMPVIENDATLTVSEIHAGAYIHTDAGTGHTVTLPSGTSGAVPPVGAVITFVNEDNNDVTLSAAGTLRWFNGTGVPSTGNRTVSQGGFVTVIHYSNTEWHILGGAGVS